MHIIKYLAPVPHSNSSGTHFPGSTYGNHAFAEIPLGNVPDTGKGIPEGNLEKPYTRPKEKEGHMK